MHAHRPVAQAGATGPDVEVTPDKTSQIGSVGVCDH